MRPHCSRRPSTLTPPTNWNHDPAEDTDTLSFISPYGRRLQNASEKAVKALEPRLHSNTVRQAPLPGTMEFSSRSEQMRGPVCVMLPVSLKRLAVPCDCVRRQAFVHRDIANFQTNGLKWVLGGILLLGAWRGGAEETRSCKFSFSSAYDHPHRLRLNESTRRSAAALSCGAVKVSKQSFQYFRGIPGNLPTAAVKEASKLWDMISSRGSTSTILFGLGCQRSSV